MHALRSIIARAALALILALTALVLNTGAAAQEEYDLTGEWIFHFSVEDGPSYADPCHVTQVGDAIKGMVIYEEGGNQYKEPFEGTVAPDGTVEFILYDNGLAVEHWGRILDDGNTVSGEWSFEGGQGAFTMTRE